MGRMDDPKSEVECVGMPDISSGVPSPNEKQTAGPDVCPEHQSSGETGSYGPSVVRYIYDSFGVKRAIAILVEGDYQSFDVLFGNGASGRIRLRDELPETGQ